MLEKVEKLAIPIKYSSLCKVCVSGFAEDIHKLRLEGKTYSEIRAFLTEKGMEKENIPQDSNFSSHFKYHFIIPNIKKQEVLEKVKRNLSSMTTLVPSSNIDSLITTDIDYLSSLKILLQRKLDSLLNLSEKLEDPNNKIDMETELSVHRLIQSIEKNLTDLLEKIDIKQEDYSGIGMIKEFVIGLVRLINTLEDESCEKELIQNFRIKVSQLVKSYES